MEKIIDRLDKYMIYRNLNDNQITVQLNLSVGLLGKSRKEGRDLGKTTIEKILNFYTELNRVWLLTGQGEMLNSNYHPIPKSNSVLMDPHFECRSIESLSKALDRLTEMYEKIVMENENLKNENEELKKVASAQRGTA